jgi:cyclic pyranopterin phosphate synthase
MPPEGVESLPHKEILRYEEILRVVRAGVSLDIDQYRITGGEPLVRKDVADFVRMVKRTPGVKYLALTTNGVLFSGMGEALKEAGLDAVNFSLDCMDAESFHQLTRVDAWDDVMKGIRTALRLGLKTKINCVPMEGYNAGDWVSLAALAKDNALDVRFIEMMPIGLGKGFKPVKNADVLAHLTVEFGEPVKSVKRHGSGPAEYWNFPGFRGSVGFISAISDAFCDRCNRVRLTADGMLKPCLCYGGGLNLKPLLRGGASDEELGKAMKEAILGKPLRHNFCESGGPSESRKMVQIGG